MNNNLAEKFVNDKGFREQYIGKTDVLNKVKLLSMLPDNEHMTIRQVSEYYEINIDAVRKVVIRHRHELVEDGLKSLVGQEFNEYKSSLGHNVLELKNVPSASILTRRAVLRVGMLLRDSEIAKQVRTYLLNVEKESKKEQRQIATAFTGTWTAKDELILLDCIYTVVNNGGTVIEAAKLASSKIDHSQAACAQRYQNSLKSVISNENLINRISRNRKGNKLKMLTPLESNTSEKPIESQGIDHLAQIIEKLKNEILEINSKYMQSEIEKANMIHDLKIKEILLEDKEKQISDLNTKNTTLKEYESELDSLKKKYMSTKKKLDAIQTILQGSKKKKTAERQEQNSGRPYKLVNGVPVFA